MAKEKYVWGLDDDIRLKNAVVEGHTDKEIAQEFGCSVGCVARHRALLGLPNSNEHGGIISKRIPLNSESTDELDDHEAFCVVTRTIVTMQGIGTGATYRIDSEEKKVTIELGGLGIEIEFGKLNDIIEELKGVRIKANGLGNPEAW